MKRVCESNKLRFDEEGRTFTFFREESNKEAFREVYLLNNIQ